MPDYDFDSDNQNANSPDVSAGGVARANGRLQAQDLLRDHRTQAFLAALAQGESSGRYNVITGGRTFDDYSRHPNINIGGSTAAGAYQFVYPTWKEQASELGLQDFSRRRGSQPAESLRRPSQIAVRRFGWRSLHCRETVGILTCRRKW